MARRNSAIDTIDSSDERCISHFRSCDAVDSWGNELFYANIIYCSHLEEYYAEQLTQKAAV